MSAALLVPIVVGLLALIGTAIGAVLTYRGIKLKADQEATANNFGAMQAEIDRLREDLSERDAQSRTNYEEIKLLREEVNRATDEIHVLQVQLAEWTTGAQVLYRQLIEAEIKPMFVPTNFKETI